MSIIEYRAKVIDKIKVSFPQLRDVMPHPGKFTLEDFERLCIRAPAAYVAIIGAPGRGKLATGQVMFEVNVGVFIATRSKSQESADVQGWRIAEAIACLAQWNYFGHPTMPADNVEIDNLWTSELDKNHVCIMGVAWDTKIRLGDDLAAQAQAIALGEGFVFPDDIGVDLTVRSEPGL